MAPQNGKNNRPQKEKSKRLYRLASKKRPQKSPERIQKARGAQNGTPKKPQNKKDARPKQANKTKRRGQKKKKKKKQQHVRGGVWCPVSPELYLFKEKREKEEKQQKTSSTQTLRQRERDKKQDLTSREFFKALPGRNCKKIRKNHRQIHTKNTRTQNESKNKSSLPKIYRANRP